MFLKSLVLIVFVFAARLGKQMLNQEDVGLQKRLKKLKK